MGRRITAGAISVIVLLSAAGGLVRAGASRAARASEPPAVPQAAPAGTPRLVEFELMTWPEVKRALAEGTTTALFYTGGTEQRGPQDRLVVIGAAGGSDLLEQRLTRERDV